MSVVEFHFGLSSKFSFSILAGNDEEVKIVVCEKKEAEVKVSCLRNIGGEGKKKV